MPDREHQSKQSPQGKLRRLVASIGIPCLLLSPLILVAGYCGITFIRGLHSPVDFIAEPFDSVTWKESQAEFSRKSHRLKMVDSLLTQHPLIGIRRENVVSLIGEPDKTEYFKRYDMVYLLGQERNPFGIDCEWLVIKLDSNGVVTEAKVVSD